MGQNWLRSRHLVQNVSAKETRNPRQLIAMLQKTFLARALQYLGFVYPNFQHKFPLESGTVQTGMLMFWLSASIIKIEGSRKAKIRCEFWVQSESLYVTNSFKKSVPVTGFLASRNADKVNAWFDVDWELLWWRHSNWCVIWSAICLGTSWNTFWCEVPLFWSQIKEPMDFYEWIMSYSRAHAVRANIRETNKRRITHLPVDSNLQLYHALIAVMSCDNSVCMRWGAGKVQSLTKDKKGSAPWPWLSMHTTERGLKCSMLHAACCMLICRRRKEICGCRETVLEITWIGRDWDFSLNEIIETKIRDDPWGVSWCIQTVVTRNQQPICSAQHKMVSISCANIHLRWKNSSPCMHS